jgi:hypothetical protein
MFDYHAGVGITDDPSNPFGLENLRRSIARPSQAARIDRDHALTMIERLQVLEQEHRVVVDELRRLLGQLETP